MLVWTENFPKWKKPLAYWRLIQARLNYFDHYRLSRKGMKLELVKKRGYRYQLRQLYNKYKGQRCFVLGNGPSLKKMDLSPLKNEITLGSNGAYKAFEKWGWELNYIFFEDVQQTELRGPEIHKIPKSNVIASLYNAYAFKANNRTLFANVRGADKIYWEEEAPMFSKDFAHIVYLGSTITYLALQFAFYLGFDLVYLLGVDHSYGKLSKLFKPGKIKITKENYSMVQECHFDKNYYKIGDVIGVPYTKYQEDAYLEAKNVFESEGRKIINVGVDSQLDVFERGNFKDLF